MEEVIIICGSHQQYQAPMLTNYNLEPGKTYWCPFCGRKAAMWDYSIMRVPVTEDLVKRKTAYEKAAKAYLRDGGNQIKWDYNKEAEKLREYE